MDINKQMAECRQDEKCDNTEFECVGRCMSNAEFLYEYFNQRGLIEKAKQKIAEREAKTV